MSSPLSSPLAFTLTLWTADPGVARAADAAGIDRIGLDLELLGKADRQAGQGTWVSPHTVDQLPPVRDSLRKAGLFARTNALHRGSKEELERLIDLGVEFLMLPNFSRVSEVEQYLRLVDGRARVIPLLERVAIRPDLPRLLDISELKEIHLGLNDLSIDLGLPARLAVLTSDFVREIAAAVCAAGVRLGVGGIGRAYDNHLPVPSDLIYGQYPRLGATAALISRSFAAEQLSPEALRAEVRKSRQRLSEWFTATKAQTDEACEALRRHFTLERTPAASR